MILMSRLLTISKMHQKLCVLPSTNGGTFFLREGSQAVNMRHTQQLKLSVIAYGFTPLENGQIQYCKPCWINWLICLDMLFSLFTIMEEEFNLLNYSKCFICACICLYPRQACICLRGTKINNKGLEKTQVSLASIEDRSHT